mmetsp:Transcript_104268/g.185316  ORF Transcript_104268/g.185316 Transcript_104268/m.185316 type:complete len:128 (+) Transcript_104268:352-735(+)
MMTSQSWIVESRCAMAMEVRSFLAASKAACTRCSLWLSKALVASSKRRTAGFRSRALQMATRCFWPPESRPPRGPTCVCHPCVLLLSKKFKFAICLHFSKCSDEISSSSSRPYFTFSKTVVLKRMGS